MKKLILFSVVLFSTASCKKDKASATNVELRIRNATSGTIFECVVNPGSSSNSYNYGRVGLDSLSNYHSFNQAYSYGYVSLVLNSTTYTIQPRDYVGETPLAPGKYTYKIILLPPNGIKTTLVKD